MFCERCGNQIKGNTLFCEKCGTDIGTLLANTEVHIHAAPDMVLDNHSEGFNTNNSNKKFVKFIKTIVVLCIIVIMAAAGIECGIYFYNNSVSNKLRIKLDLGQKYLSELNYEAALVEFQEAISIDPKNIKAYAGGIKAYQNLDRHGEMLLFYERALDVIKYTDEKSLMGNIGDTVSIYLMADYVYGKDSKEALEYHNRVRSIVANNEELIEAAELKQAVDNMEKFDNVRQYLNDGSQYLSDGKYEQAREAFQKVLDIDSMHIEAYIGIGKAYAGEKDYNKAIEILTIGYEKTNLLEISQFRNELIQENEAIQSRAFANDLLEPLYKLFEKNDMNGVITLLKTEKYQNLDSMPIAVNRLCWSKLSESSVISGKGIGLYKISKQSYNKHNYGDFGYYAFYYGDYMSGKRSGTGKWVVCGKDDIYIAEGEWSNDKPNGRQEVEITYIKNNYSSIKVETGGSVINGLWDGKMMDGPKNSGAVRNCQYEMGKYKILSLDRRGRVISAETQMNNAVYLEDDYDLENEREGILGFAGYVNNTAD